MKHIEKDLEFIIKDYDKKINKLMDMRDKYYSNQAYTQKKLIKLETDLLQLLSNREHTIAVYVKEDKNWYETH